MRRVVLSGVILSLAGCSAGGPPPAGSGSSSAVAVASDKPPALGPIVADGRPRKALETADGIPIVEAEVAAADKEGEVVFIRQGLKALDTPVANEASDGESIYLVVDGATSMLVRDGVVRENALASYGFDAGGCGAARDGVLLLSGVADSGESEQVQETDGAGRRRVYSRPAKQQVVLLIDAQGKEKRIALPRSFGEEANCRAWLAQDGTFSLGLFQIVHYDGSQFSDEAPGWYAGRTVMGKPNGGKLCFWSCNGPEAAQTHPDTAALSKALDFHSGALPTWIAHDDWVAGIRKGRALRKKLGSGDIEVLDGVPDSKILNGSYDIAFTARHDLVIALDYGYARYVVWPHGETKLSPERTLARGERIANASPTLLVRGMTTPIPDSNTFAVVLGKDIDIGTGGSTFGFVALQRGAQAHKARMDRARRVLPAGKLVAGDEAVVETQCGAYVRSPVGWEGELIHDWTPPQLPALSPKAVFTPPSCFSLDQVSALPGDTDLLLGMHAGELWGAWLPPPLPLPAGTSHWQTTPPAPPPVVTPRPGSGWSLIGAVDKIDGDQAIIDPGGNTNISYGSWQAGGAAVIEAGGKTIVVTGQGAVTVPKGTVPMAIGQTQEAWLYGALGSKLVACRDACRILDPGPKSDIVAAVPRTETALVLGYADGRIGTYHVPAAGGEAVPASPLVAKLNALLKSKP